MARMQLPKNDLPAHMHEQVKIVNATTDVTFIEAWGRMDPNASGDIVLGPRMYCYRQKFEAMYWFGNWTKTGKDWEAEVTRIGKMYALLDPNNPVWCAIRDHKIYVEGHNENADYRTFSLTKFVDKLPQFKLGGPEDSTAYIRNQGATKDYLDLPAEYGSEIPTDITPLKK